MRNISETNTTAQKYLPTTSKRFLCTHTATSRTKQVVWLTYIYF